MELLKSCTRCKVEKPLNNEYFPPHNKTKSGFDSWCRVCRREYRNANSRGKYRQMISDEHLQVVKNETKECVICGSNEKLVVDHDHKTNKIRGMLCNHCNRGLGHFRDDPQLLEFARIYLLSYSNDTSEAEYLKENV